MGDRTTKVIKATRAKEEKEDGAVEMAKAKANGTNGVRITASGNGHQEIAKGPVLQDVRNQETARE